MEILLSYLDPTLKPIVRTMLQWIFVSVAVTHTHAVRLLPPQNWLQKENTFRFMLDPALLHARARERFYNDLDSYSHARHVLREVLRCLIHAARIGQLFLLEPQFVPWCVQMNITRSWDQRVNGIPADLLQNRFSPWRILFNYFCLLEWHATEVDLYLRIRRGEDQNFVADRQDLTMTELLARRGRPIPQNLPTAPPVLIKKKNQHRPRKAGLRSGQGSSGRLRSAPGRRQLAGTAEVHRSAVHPGEHRAPAPGLAR